ncbi:MAG: hypothetical protein P0Y65_02960 [Candidatus Devosia phytovorans]|uniref:Type II toxin-antitoxin system ParD family antitoxin n=1 Tax=Candidatus Devosia phytovorans TaxID=3121372 RepID=A0AAJ5VWJ4_9HYPH|nr:hypothetical protein [Devosia sp.]WEK05235.1 MAG: hypothetical protein P0Y65_02960 [Devosia sp.]
MDQPDKLTVTISDDQAERIRESVARGEFESADEMVRMALDEQQHAARLAELKRQILHAADPSRPVHSAASVREHMRRQFESAERLEQQRARRHDTT